ncbi:MAG: hypothetical protein ACPG4X_08070 [Pikeienuella sp.]
MPTTFDGFGVEVVANDGRFLLRYDSTEGIGSPMIEREISEAESVRVTRSQKDADAVVQLAERGARSKRR